MGPHHASGRRLLHFGQLLDERKMGLFSADQPRLLAEESNRRGLCGT